MLTGIVYRLLITQEKDIIRAHSMDGMLGIRICRVMVDIMGIMGITEGGLEVMEAGIMEVDIMAVMVVEEAEGEVGMEEEVVVEVE